MGHRLGGSNANIDYFGYITIVYNFVLVIAIHKPCDALLQHSLLNVVCSQTSPNVFVKPKEMTIIV